MSVSALRLLPLASLGLLLLPLSGAVSPKPVSSAPITWHAPAGWTLAPVQGPKPDPAVLRHAIDSFGMATPTAPRLSSCGSKNANSSPP